MVFVWFFFQKLLADLTHWGRVTHICVGKLTIIGSDNGLSPGRRQAIIWTNAGILLIRPLGTNFSEILIAIETFSFKKMHLKISSAKWRSFCLGFNVLRSFTWIKLPHRRPYIWAIWCQKQISQTWVSNSLRWRHNDHAGVSNHQPHGCLLNRLFRRRSKKTSKLRVTGRCAVNSPGTGEFSAQMASYAENVSIWWRHHGTPQYSVGCNWTGL